MTNAMSCECCAALTASRDVMTLCGIALRGEVVVIRLVPFRCRPCLFVVYVNAYCFVPSLIVRSQEQ